MFERPGTILRYLRRLTPREAITSKKRITRAALLLGIERADSERHLPNAESISEIREAMLLGASAPIAINNTLGDLRGVARAAHEMGGISAEELAAASAVPDVPDPKRGVRLLAGWELSAVISACVREGTARGARDAALIALMYAGGLNLQRATGLKVSDWWADDALLRVGSHGDITRGRPVPLGEDAAALLRRWFALRESAFRERSVDESNSPEQAFLVVDRTDFVQDRPLTPSSAGGILKKRADEAKVRRFSHADLRRTAAADMLTSGARYSEVRRILGYPTPELERQILEDYRRSSGPKVRAVRLGSRHVDYFDIVGGFHFQNEDFSAGEEDGEPEWPNSFEGHSTEHAETPWGTVAWKAIGDGPPVVLVHGIPWSSFCWRKVAPGLSARRSVYAYDLLGHGDSEKAAGHNLSLAAQARVLAWLVDEWRLEAPAVVAHGTGTAVALRTHLLEEVAFGRIVLIDPTVTGSWLSPAERHIKEHPEAYRTMPEGMFRAILETHLQTDIRRPRREVDLQPYLTRWRGKEGQLAYVRTIEQLDEEHTTEVERHLGSIEAPLLVLAGDTEEAPTGTCARHLYQIVSEARLGGISWCGPFLPEEAPEDVARAVCCFLS